MSERFEISVIIPVFNAERFIRRAIESAISQPEVAEIVVVDDGSTDSSVKIVNELASSSVKRIVVARHQDGANHGAGASRNLGISRAACCWIAFLDADDYYLPGRFVEDRRVLEADSSLDGAYDALGLDVEDAAAGWWEKSGAYGGLVTMLRNFHPSELFSHMDPVGVDGAFTTDTILVHRRLFDKTQSMFGSLRFGEDTLLWMQMAAVGRLAPASLDKPVAMRGVHGGNSIRSLTDHRAAIGKVFSAFETWEAFPSLSKGDITAFRRAQIHLASNWSDAISAMAKTNGWFSAAAWKSLFRWALIRQFPEDPVLPGFFPALRRRKV